MMLKFAILNDALKFTSKVIILSFSNKLKTFLVKMHFLKIQHFQLFRQIVSCFIFLFLTSLKTLIYAEKASWIQY